MICKGKIDNIVFTIEAHTKEDMGFFLHYLASMIEQGRCHSGILSLSEKGWMDWDDQQTVTEDK